MSSAAHQVPGDYQPDIAALSTTSGALKVSSPFRILDNLSPAKNEEVCVMNGFPKFSDIIDLPAMMPTRAESKIDAKPDASSDSSADAPLPTVAEALDSFVKNVVLNFDEQKALSMFNGIVRQVANYSLSPQDIVNSIERMIKSAKEPIDFAKIACVLNSRLQSSELKYASVALQIQNGKEVFAIMSRGEAVFKAPLQV